jgi:hypothetical protein
VLQFGAWQRLSECDVYAVGGTLLLWFSCAVLLVYLPNVAWYAYGVKTTPDVGGVGKFYIR